MLKALIAALSVSFAAITGAQAISIDIDMTCSKEANANAHYSGSVHINSALNSESSFILYGENTKKEGVFIAQKSIMTSAIMRKNLFMSETLEQMGANVSYVMTGFNDNDGNETIIALAKNEAGEPFAVLMNAETNDKIAVCKTKKAQI